MVLPARLARYLAAGDAQTQSPEHQRAMVLTHSIAVTIGAMTLPYAPLFLWLGAWGLGIAVVPIAVFYLLVPACTRRFGLTVTRGLIFTLFPTVVAAYAAAFGERAQIQLLFYVTLTLPVLLTAASERRLRTFGLVMPIACALGLELFGYRWAGAPVVGPAVQQGLRVALTATTFAFLLVALLYFARSTRRAEASLSARNGEMRQILDRVDQGFLTLDEGFTILPEHSAKVREWLGEDVAGKPFAAQVAAQDPAAGAWLAVSLEQLAVGLLPPAVALDQLPRRLRLGDRTVTLEAKLLAERPLRLLVVMTDVTLALAREREGGEREDLLRALEHVTRDPHGLRIFQREAQRLLGETGAFASPGARLGALHTLKGNAAVLGFLDVARACHELEDRAREVDELGAADVEPLRRKVTRLLEALPMGGDDASAVVAVPRGAYEELLLALQDGRPHANVLALASAWATAPVELHLRRLATQAEQLAKRLDKGPVQVVVDTDGIRVDERLDELFAVLTHLVRNAVDHGLEAADERLRLGKPATGSLRLAARRDGDDVIVSVEDDGRGIAWEDVLRRAREMAPAAGDGAPPERPGEATSDQAFSEEARRALFLPGVSTRAQVTEISGRGVGLAAVKETVERLGGSVAVRSVRGAGACFEIRVPWPGVPRGGSIVLRSA